MFLFVAFDEAHKGERGGNEDCFLLVLAALTNQSRRFGFGFSDGRREYIRIQQPARYQRTEAELLLSHLWAMGTAHLWVSFSRNRRRPVEQLAS